MVKYSEEELDLAFHALSDSTRRAMLRQLNKSDCSVGDLAEPHKMSFAAISKHLKVLEQADFVEKIKEGRSYRCRANPQSLTKLYQTLETLGAFWRARLDALDQFLINEKENENDSASTDKGTAKVNRKKAGRSKNRKGF